MKKIILFAIGLLLVILSIPGFAGPGDDNTIILTTSTTVTDTIAVGVQQVPDFYCADQCTFYVVAYPCGEPGKILDYELYSGSTTLYILHVEIEHPGCVCVTIIPYGTCTCSWSVIPDCQSGPPFSPFVLKFGP